MQVLIRAKEARAQRLVFDVIRQTKYYQARHSNKFNTTTKKDISPFIKSFIRLNIVCGATPEAIEEWFVDRYKDK